MAVKIRLQRQGKRSEPVFRIILTDESNKRDGKSLDILGTYNPITNPPTVIIDRQKLDKYVSQGAQMSKTVASITRVKKIVSPNTLAKEKITVNKKAKVKAIKK